MLLPLVGRLLELQTHLTLLLAPSVVTLLLTLAGNISNFFFCTLGAPLEKHLNWCFDYTGM